MTFKLHLYYTLKGHCLVWYVVIVKMVASFLEARAFFILKYIGKVTKSDESKEI